MEQKRAREYGARDDGQLLGAIEKNLFAEFRAVMHALQDEALESPSIPMAARRMLAEGARPWLGSATKGGLHGLQERILGQIRETFKTIASGMDSRVEGEAKAVEAKMLELNGLEAQLQDAAGSLSQADAQLEVQREKQSKAEEQVNASQLADREFKERQKARAKEAQVIQDELRQYTSTEEGLKSLVEGTCPTEDTEKACEKFMKELQKLGPDPALLAALPMVLQKKPEERTRFDLVVLDGVKDMLRKTMDAVESRLSAAKEATDSVKQEAGAHVAASVKLYSDLDAEIREVQLAEELRKDRAAAAAALGRQAEDCRKALAASTTSAEASKAARERFLEVQDALEILVSAAAPLEGPRPAAPLLGA